MTIINLPWYIARVRNPIGLIQPFFDACLNDFNMNHDQAIRHHNFLTKDLPVGFIYYDTVTQAQLAENTSYRLLGVYKTLPDVPVYNDKGVVDPNKIHVIRKAPDEPIVSPSYLPLIAVPHDTEISVCWGSQATVIEYGRAKMVFGEWYKYGERNPHANGRPCATPTAWVKNQSK